MLEYLQRHYVPRATVVSVAGQVEHDAVLDTVRRTLGAGRDGGEPAAYEPARPGAAGPRVHIVEKDTEQAHLCIGLPALSYLDPDRYAQQLLDSILGGGMSSRLFVEIREKRALAYTVASYVDNFRDAGGLILYAGVDNEQVGNCISGMLHELDRLRQQPPSAEELRKVKEYNKGSLLLALESSRSVASWGGRQELLLDRIYDVDEVIERIEAVTPDDVQRLAGRLFQQSQLSLSVVGPFADGDEFQKLLTLA